MIGTIRLEVRCCCDPSKLLGYLQVPARLAYTGAKIGIPVLEGLLLEAGQEPRAQYGRIDLEVGRVCAEGERGEGHLAVKSNDTSIEALRKIPGFEEVLR